MTASSSRNKRNPKQDRPFLFRPKAMAALTLTGIAAAVMPAAAWANNEQAQINARSCSPYLGGCVEGTSFEPVINGVRFGGAYAFASGYEGGYATASAVFAPGAGPLLQSGLYSNGSVAFFTYSFRVEGAPDTLVPLHMEGRLSSTAIHITDESGQVVDLVDGVSPTAPTRRWKVVADAGLQIVPVRRTPLPIGGANISLAVRYLTSSSVDSSFCQNCDGGSSLLDQTVWVWSNSDINVNVGADMLLEYSALGDGLDPLSLFGTVSIEADPTFTIDDPAYAGFTIVGVPTGFAPPQVSAVPEPQTAALLLGGLGFVGAMVRRKAGPRSAP